MSSVRRPQSRTATVARALDELDRRVSEGSPEERAQLARDLLRQRRQDPAGFDRALNRAIEEVAPPEPGQERGLFGPKWRNYLRDFDVPIQKDDWWSPVSVKALARSLEGAVAAGRRVRCVGSGHSSSTVAVPDEVLVEITGLDRLEIAPPWVRPVPLAPGHHLVYAEAGLVLRDLTRRLWEVGLALENMGSYDGQTLAGAVSTGTHGSGLHTGPFPDLVHAIDLLTVEEDGTVRVVRFERDEGPTDPARWAQVQKRFGVPAVLEKDTDAFEAAVVSLGCLGVVVGFVLEVVDAFWMEEVREVTTWPALRPHLRDRVEQARLAREHFEVTVLPNPVDGEIRCMKLVRRRHPRRPGKPPERQLTGQWLLDLADVVGTRPLGWFATLFPELLQQKVVESFHTSAATPFVSSAPKVFVLGYGASLDITSNEAHVPLDRAVDAIDLLVETAAEQATHHRFHVCPVGVRFAGSSRAAISMESARENVTLEVPFPLGYAGWRVMVEELEDRFVHRLDARMHWGQVNTTTAARAARSYPRWDRFLALWRRFGHHGTWRSPFTDAMGL